MSRLPHIAPLMVLILAPLAGAQANVATEGGPSVREVEAIARRMVVAAYSGDEARFLNHFDRSAVLAEAQEKLGAAQVVSNLELIQEQLQPWHQVQETIEAGGDFRFLRAWIQGDSILAQFRLTLFLGFDYHTYRFKGARLIPVPTQAGVRQRSETCIVDTYLLSRNEYLSETLARRATMDEKVRESLKRLQVHAARGESEAGLDYYSSLGERVGANKDFMCARSALVGMSTGDDGRRAALAMHADETQRLRPERIHMQLAHSHELLDDSMIERALQRLEQLTADRAFCEYFRGNLDLRSERWTEAQKHFARALMIDPGYEDPLWDLIQIYRETQNYTALVAVLERLVVRYGYRVEDLVQGPEFRLFLASEVYAEWMKRRAHELIR